MRTRKNGLPKLKHRNQFGPARRHCGYVNPRKVDGRTNEGKEFRALIANAANDCGGLENISSKKANLIESYAVSVFIRRRLDAAIIAHGQDVKTGELLASPTLVRDANTYANRELKLCAILGLEREARQIDGHLPPATSEA